MTKWVGKCAHAPAANAHVAVAEPEVQTHGMEQRSEEPASRSGNPAHMVENLAIFDFELPDEIMARLATDFCLEMFDTLATFCIRCLFFVLLF